MLDTRRRLGAVNAMLAALEPGGGLQPSIVTKGNSLRDSRNQTDEDLAPEEGLSRPSLGANVPDMVFTPDILTALAGTDEVSDLLDRITSYIAIEPDLGTNFAYVDADQKLVFANNNFREKFIEDLQRHWQMITDMMFSKSASLSIGVHLMLTEWLVQGIMYACIIREKRHGPPIDIHLQTAELKQFTTKRDGECWKTDLGQVIWEREDIFMVSYKEINPYVYSFAASLLKAYNLFKTTERTRVANAIMAAQFRTVYTVPTQGLGKIKARQKLSSVMSLYKRDIRINDLTGQVTVNGENSWPVNTELWVAETSQGSVKVDNPGDGNVNLNNLDLVEYLMRRFYKRGKLPMSKYEAADASYLAGLSNNDEDDRQFAQFIQKCRSVWSKCFRNLLWRFIEPLQEYSGRTELKAGIKFNWYNEPDHKTPDELLDGQKEIMNRISDMLDKYKDMLTECGFGKAQIQARLNVYRIKLMRKFLPDVLEQTAEDYSNVPAEEQADSADNNDWNNTGWDSNTDAGGNDNYSDWDDSQWDASFNDEDNNGDDWSMPEDNSNDWDSFDDTDWS